MGHRSSRQQFIARIAPAIILSALIGFVRADEPPTTSPTSAPADTVKVKRDKLNLTITAAGAFEPVDPFEVRLRFKAYQGDLVVVSAAAPGSQVGKGDTILQLEDTQIKRQIAGAESERAAALANFDKAKSDVALGNAGDSLALKMQQDEVKNAENALKWWEEVDGKQLLQDADLSIQYGQDSVDDQQDELDQLKKMYKSEELTNATADIVVKRALRALRNSKTNLGMTAERSKKTKEVEYEVQHAKVKYAIDQQKQALEQLEAQQKQSKILRDTGLTAAKIGLDTADEKLANLKSDFEQFNIHAPQSMTIYWGQLVNGSWTNNGPRILAAGEKIVLQPPQVPPGVQMTGAIPGKLRFVGVAPEERVLLLKKDQHTRVSCGAMPQLELEGVVQEPLPVITEGVGYRVLVNFAADIPQLAPGMKGTMKVDPGIDEKMLLVPVAAIKDDKAWIHQANGTDKSIDVVTGRSDGDLIEIVKGLGEGDEILATAKK